MRLSRIAALTIALIACAKQAEKAPQPSETQLMDQGVQMLYQKSDPVGAERVFRDVLQRNPAHYGAQYQLAVALDRGGRPTEARPLWQQVLMNATTVKDTATMRVARTRLAAPDTASQGAMMTYGLDLLYRQNNPAAASEQFRKVIARNPTHYGATYQLAIALEKSGQGAQAKPLWEKVLGMATMYKDTATANTARSHLR